MRERAVRGLRRARRDFVRFRRRVHDVELPYRIVVVTHHKTGTVWLSSVFRRLAHHLGLTMVRGEPPDLPEDWGVLFRPHGQVDFSSLPMPFRGTHMIRDPRDVVVSGCFYHQNSGETWLHEAREEFNGRSYQEAICSLPSVAEQLRFEMDHQAARVITQMMDWDFERDDIFEVKYEHLIVDTELQLFHELFTFIGIPGSEIPEALKIAHGSSLFSGKVRAADHVRSGAPRQWEQQLTRELRADFEARFPDVLQHLGYERDSMWIRG